MYQSACISTVIAFHQGPAMAVVLRIFKRALSTRSRSGTEAGGECRDRGRGFVLGNKVRTEARDLRAGASQPTRFQFAGVSRVTRGRLPPTKVLSGCGAGIPEGSGSERGRYGCVVRLVFNPACQFGSR